MSLLDIITEVANRNPMFLADNAPRHTPAINDKGDRHEPYYQERRPPRRENVRHREHPLTDTPLDTTAAEDS